MDTLQKAPNKPLSEGDKDHISDIFATIVKNTSHITAKAADHLSQSSTQKEESQHEHLESRSEVAAQPVTEKHTTSETKK